MRKHDYREESNPKVIKKVWRAKALECSHCKPHRVENAKRKAKHGSRPPRSKNRPH